jgi:RNA polymerase-binding protein DksA
MDAKILKQQKKKLLSERKRLLNELNKLTQKNKKKGIFRIIWPEFGTKEDESAREVEAYEQNLVLEKNLENSLKDVEAALQRIENNTYGKCEICKKDIAIERLKAFPVATLCIECKSKLEKK